MGAAFVKNVGTSINGNSTTAAITVPAGGVAAGSRVIVHTDRASNGATVTGVVDTAGNTYTKLTEESTNGPSTSVWVGNIVSALVSGNTITATFSSKGANATSADEFSGVTNTTDGTATHATGTSTTPSTGITPTNATDLIVGQVDVNTGSADGFTEDTDNTGGDTWHSLTTVTDGSNHKLHPAYKITTSAAAQTYSPVLGTSRLWNVLIAALQDNTVAATGGLPDSPGRERRRIPVLGRQPGQVRTWDAASTQVLAPQSVPQPRRIRGVGMHQPGQVRAWETVPAQVVVPNPAIIFSEVTQPRRLRGLLARKARPVETIPVQIAVVAPSFRFSLVRQARTVRGMLARRVGQIGQGPPRRGYGPCYSLDSFNRANGSTVATRLGSTDGTGSLDPLTWTKGFPGVETEGLNVQSNLVGNGGNDVSTPHAYHIAYVDLGVADLQLSIDAALGSFSGTSTGLLLRYTDDNNFWAVQWARTGRQVNLYKTVAGTESLVTSTGDLGVSFGTLKVVARADNISLYDASGTLVTTITDSFNSTATKHGLAMRNDPAGSLNNATLNNWSACPFTPDLIAAFRQLRRTRGLPPRRLRRVEVVPTQATTVDTSIMWSAPVEHRRIRGVLRRKARPVEPVPQQNTLDPPGGIAQPRRVRGLGIQKPGQVRIWDIVPPQFNPPYPFSEIVQWRRARLRRRVVTKTEASPPQNAPVVETHQDRVPRGFLRRKAIPRFEVTPPQLNPPYPFTEVKQPRVPRGLLRRKAKPVETNPSQTVIVPAFPFPLHREARTLRGLSRARGHGATFVAPQESPLSQRRRTLSLRRRAVAHIETVPPQFVPPFPFPKVVQPRRLRGMQVRRARRFEQTPVQDAPVAEIRQDRAPRGLLRRKAVPRVEVTPPQFNPPFPFSPIVQPRRARGLLRRRAVPHVETPSGQDLAALDPLGQPRRPRGGLRRKARPIEVVPAQVPTVDPSVMWSAPEQARRFRGIVRRPRARIEVIPAQQNPPFPFSEVVQPRRVRGLLGRRARRYETVAAQERPVIETKQRQVRGVRLGRGRAAQPVPPQVNPPFPFSEVVQPRRVRGLLSRRARRSEPVGPQDQPTSTVKARRRGVRLGRGRAWQTVPPQFNPPFPFAELKQPRTPRGFLRRRVRPVETIPTQAVVVTPFPFSLVRQARTVRGVSRRRGRGTTNVAGQDTPLISRRRALSLRRRPTTRSETVRAQQNPPFPTSEISQPRRPRGLLRRRGRAVEPITGQQTPPAIVRERRAVPGITGRRKGPRVEPIPAQVRPPYPIELTKQPRRPRGLRRRPAARVEVPVEQSGTPAASITRQLRRLRALFRRPSRRTETVAPSSRAPRNFVFRAVAGTQSRWVTRAAPQEGWRAIAATETRWTVRSGSEERWRTVAGTRPDLQTGG